MAVVHRVVEALRLAFFRSFFSLLLAAIAASEWAMLVRVLAHVRAPLPAAAHVIGPVVFWLANRAVLRARAGGVARGAVRVYARAAFTSLFCGVFLLLTAVAAFAARLGATSVAFAVGAPLALRAPGAARLWQLAVDAGVAGIVATFVWGYTGGRRALAVTERRIAVPGLPSPLDGLRIVHLSDLHIGDHLGLAELAAHVARVNALAPDLVCITGDLVDRAATCAAAFPVLGGLRARHGVFVVLGNHDVAAGADAVTAALRRHTAFTVLRNARADVTVGPATLAIAGVDDRGRDWARGVPEHPALPGVVAGVPAGAVLVVLSHRPDCFPQAARLGAALVLSGHTHGGQLGVRLPWRGRVRNLAEFITAFDRGVYEAAGATLVVSCGLGFTGQPIRLFTPREIGCLELRAA